MQPILNIYCVHTLKICFASPLNLFEQYPYIPIHVLLCLHQAWPEDALEMVANKFLDDVEMSYNVRKEVVFMCKYFHESVRALSEK